MDAKEFLGYYRKDGHVRAVAESLRAEGPKAVRFKNLRGSLDAALAAAVYAEDQRTHLFILHDKEEAAYFLDDLQALLPEKEPLLFPTSYKKPYQFLETENANIVQRAETLSAINQKAEGGELIVTYPDALSEKVINQRSLIDNTFVVKKGEELSLDFIRELLVEYEFEMTDFVSEAGQFAVRGGIVDVFSYSHDKPYRIELFGDEIDSIRAFDPVSQLSEKPLERISIVPNVQTRLLQEVREGFLKFLPPNAKIWYKDYQAALDVVQRYFEQATKDFAEILKSNGGTQVVKEPSELFDGAADFKRLADGFAQIEFGNRFYLDGAEEFEFNAGPQPSFNKDFKLFAKDLERNQSRGYVNVVASDSFKQLQRIATIFEEIDPDLEYRELNVALREGFVDHDMRLACYTDHQLFERYHRAKQKAAYSRNKAITLKELRELKAGDYVTHADYGIARFGGMEKVVVGEREQESIRLVFRDNDLLYISVHALHKLAKYSGQDGQAPTMSKLGSQEWENKKKKVKRKVKDIARDLIKLYAKRKAAPGFAYSEDTYLQAELESSFLYEDTPDQAKATQAVKEDMQQQHPMDRLVCGDVGFGKTEVAIRAAFKAVTDSKQVAVLVPTTILAMQHYKTFKERLRGLPCNVSYVNRFKSTKEIKETLKQVEQGSIDILIGTHRIAGKDVKFNDLGLLIVDEEQKFGVKTKEKLKEMRVNVDTLTLTATPIPRTLQFSLLGARDLSVIATPPPNRQPVTTELHSYDEIVIRDAIRHELKRNGQAFFVHNRISDIDSMANKVMELVPDARVCVAHGQMEGAKLERVMMQFINGEYDVLVSTNIIESGLDIPTANTILINRAHMFGLSDLHQMRGRVGRSNRKAYCYLLTPGVAALTAEARKRLSALEEFTDLGDGFKIAMRDLDIRGAGNLLGGEQSGFINDLGFDMYHQILDDAVKELREEEFKELFQKGLDVDAPIKADTNVETDMEILIPDSYVSSVSERLNLYMRADSLENDEQLEKFRASLRDRFGPLPEPVTTLLETVRLRWQAETLGIEKLSLKNGAMKAYLMTNDNARYYNSDVFGKMLEFAMQQPHRCRVKDAKKRVILAVEDVETVAEARRLLSLMSGAEEETAVAD